MKKDNTFQEPTGQVSQKLKNIKNRVVGILLIALGVVLGIVSMDGEGSFFQDFSSGVLAGLSVGILLVGILVTLLFFIKKEGGGNHEAK